MHITVSAVNFESPASQVFTPKVPGPIPSRFKLWSTCGHHSVEVELFFRFNLLDGPLRWESAC